MTMNMNRYWMNRMRTASIAGAAALSLSLLGGPLRAAAMPQQDPRDPQPEVIQVTGLTPEQKVQRITGAMNRLVVGGRATGIEWSEDGTSVTFSSARKRLKFDMTTKSLTPVEGEADADDAGGPPQRGGNRAARGGQGQVQRGGMPARGRQREREVSPDGAWVAVCKDWNVTLEPGARIEAVAGDEAAAGPRDATPIPITSGGNRKFRYGTASWVYGEELDQRDAMWWSPDSSKLAFYEFDEREVPDHFIAAGLTDLHTKVLTEGYPKPGEPNPLANIQIYDVATKKIARIESPSDGEWYTYAVRWSPDGKSLLFNRTNRHQDELHVMAADPVTGATRIIVTEKQKTWQANRPLMRFLEDGQRFIWESEKNGWKNYELRDLSGKLLATLTNNEYPVAGITRIDEASNVLYYTAYSEKSCPLNAQLHRVNLDGSGEKRLTSELLNHTTIELSPDGKWFIATAEAVDAMPSSAIYSTSGERLGTLCESDRSSFDGWHMPMPELFSFKADDGVTDIYGVLFKPSDFDAEKKYPLLIDVYGGPESQGVRNRFTAANATCEYGFLIAKIDNRGTVGRGKAFESATYLRLGDKDMKDQADGVRFLAKRPYVDGTRVGIFGHSYGGYMSALAVLKHPDVFHVAVAGAPVTDWKNYDTIYTERYMRTPQENADGYEVGSCLKYAENLKGKLLIVQGMVDDNVHPNNVWQLVDLLQKADKPFDMMFYPTYDHGVGGNYSQLRWRYLREHLGVN